MAGKERGIQARISPLHEPMITLRGFLREPETSPPASEMSRFSATCVSRGLLTARGGTAASLVVRALFQ